MVHAPDRSVTQHGNTPDSTEILRSKYVIDAAIVDCRVSGGASEIAKAAQDMTVRFTVVFQIVRIQVAFIRRFELEVEITANENGTRLRALLGPIDLLLCVGAAPSSIEGIGVRTQEHDFGRVAVRSERSGERVAIAN